MASRSLYYEPTWDRLTRKFTDKLIYFSEVSTLGNGEYQVCIYSVHGYSFILDYNLCIVLGISEQDYQNALKKYNEHPNKLRRDHDDEFEYFQNKSDINKMIKYYLNPLLKKAKEKIEPKMIARKLNGEDFEKF